MSPKKSPIPIDNRQQKYCPVVLRDETGSSDSQFPLVLPKVKAERVLSSKKSSTPSSDDLGFTLLNALQSPEGSAFDKL
jgi:hypothetical protein